jgi:hypothetical protein
MQTKSHKLTKRYISTKKRSKKYKGGGLDNDINNAINTVKTDMKPSPGLKYAWIMFGVSSVYILIKLVTK